MALFYVLQPKKRQSLKALSLFHEQRSGPTFQSAEIDVVIVDENHRMSMLSTDEIHIKMSLGQKKESLRVNGKSITIDQWITMLVTAGMGRDNYFVIRQGECTKLAMASPTERLSTLEAFAGSIDFESKKKDCQLNLANIKRNLRDTKDDLQQIEKRISEVGGDKQVLEEFNKLEGKKRAIKYVLLNKEQSGLSKKLEKFMKKKKESDKKQKKLNGTLASLKSELQKTKEQYDLVVFNVKRLENEKKSLQDELETRVKDELTVEVAIKSNNENMADRQAQVDRHTKEKDETQNEIKDMEDELNRAEEKLEEENEFCRKIRENICQREEEKNGYFNKIGYRQLFSTVEEKNDWLKNALEEMKPLIKSKEVKIKDVNESLANRKKKLVSYIKQLAYCRIIMLTSPF